MEESYCGRSCKECTKREQIRCYGCKTETINQLGNDCELAKCAYEKGLESCRMCENKGSCSGLKTREEMPNYQSRESRNVYLINRGEEERKAMLARRAPFLGKWLRILFLLIISNYITSLFLGFIPGTDFLGEIISTIFGVARGIIFIKISCEEIKYRTAGICLLILSCSNKVLLGIMTLSQDKLTQNLIGIGLIVIVLLSVMLLATYNEYMAHAIVLENVNDNLSAKWRILWKWNVGLILGMLGSVFLIFLAPILAALFILAGAVGILICGILYWVYLYRTAKVFREYIPS